MKFFIKYSFSRTKLKMHETSVDVCFRKAGFVVSEVSVCVQKAGFIVSGVSVFEFKKVL